MTFDTSQLRVPTEGVLGFDSQGSHLSVIVPVDESVGGGPCLDGAGEVNGAAGLDEELVVADDGSPRF